MTVRRPLAAILLVLACTADGGSDSGIETGEDTADSATTSTTASTGTTPSTGATGSDGETTESSSGGGESSGGSSGGSSESAGSSGSETGGPTIPCGDGTCPLGDVCVIPCCGGAGPPPCYDPDPNLACMGTDALVSPGKCDTPCENRTACCQPGACVPDPPFCVTEAELTCDGTQCNYADCFGYFEMDFLNCTCG